MASKKKSRRNQKEEVPSQAFSTPEHLIMKAPNVSIPQALNNLDVVVQQFVCDREVRLNLEQSLRILTVIVQDYLRRNPETGQAPSPAAPKEAPAPAAPHVSKKVGSSKRKKKSS